jgi:hypothetical protein
MIRSRRRLLGILGAGALLLGLLVAADYLPPGAQWYAGHPMTASAIGTIVTFVAIGLLVENWIREREAAQLFLVSTVAYRSLAQHVNDAGRSLLAPVVGADLSALAVPGCCDEDAPTILARLDRAGLKATFDQTTGSWRGITTTTHGASLRRLCAERDFVQLLFRTSATCRRRLHDATAMWAPVMLTSRWSSADLGRLRLLTDAMELLQERCRLSGAIGRDAAWEPGDAWLDAVSTDFWVAIAAYERLRDDFAELAELPSDAIVRRRG